jgi:periplasmic protein TonB
MFMPPSRNLLEPKRPADPKRRFQLALGTSILLHAAVLSLQFGFPVAPRLFQDKPLEIVLVNSKSAIRPTDAMALAQANLDGGGNTDEVRHAKTPLPASREFKDGDQLEAAEQRVRELEARQRALLAHAKKANRPLVQQQPREAQPTQPPEVAGIDLAANAIAMARLQAQIDRNVDYYNKRPKKKFVGARTEDYRFAQYIEDWRLKVERIGTINYPEAARGKLYGSLVLTVVLLADGNVEHIEINRSSGHQVLDDAARRIVQLGAPYAAFPPEIRREFDQVGIVRTWFFTRDDSLYTN